ncbi:phosphate acyltransferase PlsX [Dehalococcoidia bacterium]|nr:phosphate acyltransferase PlsX [Dehalococcoidia bacterium]
MSDQIDRTFTVALDAMGGDNAPAELVAGAVQAAQQGGIEVLLVGDKDAIEPELVLHDIEGLPISMIPSQGIIRETDHPVKAMREKPQASVLEAAKLVNSGRANAMVSMGSTGAAMAAATLVLGLLDPLERPAIGGPLLGQLSPVVLVDVGSNVDCRPYQLLGYAAIGAAFARSVMGVKNPRVALLSVGTEEGKGNRQVREAYPMFQASSLNFVGNVEGTDFFLDKADVVACDGFVGNALLKFAEGLGMALAHRLPSFLDNRLPPEGLQKLADHLANMTNPAEVGGGGPLFGVDGVVIVGHGRVKSNSVAKAITMAKRVVDLDMVATMREELAALTQPAKG